MITDPVVNYLPLMQFVRRHTRMLGTAKKEQSKKGG